MGDVTVLYYSASRENEIFESNIRNFVLKNKGDLPVVSVTQKPVEDFGHNICVGEHQACYGNEFKQILIGLKSVKTEYILTAESDFIYPQEYFSFKPSGEDYYRFGNVWVVYADISGKAFYKGFSDGAQCIKRDFFINKIEKCVNENDPWFENGEKLNEMRRFKTITKNVWSSNIPAVTFKTGNNVSRFTQVKDKEPKDEIPYWGNVIKLIKEIYG